MARQAQPVTLNSNETRSLKTILTRGTTSARTLSRARILDLLHRQKQPADVAALLQVSPQTVYNVKRRYFAGGLQAALFDQPRSGRPVEFDGKQRARITALACSTPQKVGHAGLCACLQTKLLNLATVSICRTPLPERF